MAKDFGAAERRIGKIFAQGKVFTLNENTYEILFSGKPTCKSGEPKTDIYVLLENDGKVEEIKISYKKENADFLENKTNAERAKQIFGPNWNVIIEESTLTLKKQFEDRLLCYKTF